MHTNGDLSFRELNLILKAIEFDENNDAKTLYHKLRKIVEEMQNTNIEINKKLKENEISLD